MTTKKASKSIPWTYGAGQINGTISDWKCGRGASQMGTALYSRVGARGTVCWSERRLMHVDEAKRIGLI